MAIFFICGRIGGGSAPWIAIWLANYYTKAPLITMGSLAMATGIVCCALQETHGKATKETMEDYEDNP